MSRLARVLGTVLVVVLYGGQVAVATPSVTVGLNVNLTMAPGNQAEAVIAVDPNDNNRVFMVSMSDDMTGFRSARSSDGGVTWIRGRVATGNPLPLACCDPSLSWDSFGNLFLAYINNATQWTTVVAVSADGGATFGTPVAVDRLPDQPTVTAGPGSVWVTYSGRLGYMWAAGAPVTGLGAVGTFSAPVAIPDTFGLSYGDVAVGPAGEVAVANGPAIGTTGGTIVVNVSTGLGQPFGAGIAATTTGIGGFLGLPAQPNRGTDSEAGLAFDRSGGPHAGRLYLVYVDASPPGSFDTNIFLRFSDDGGATWSSPIQVNDDAGTNSQFLPRISVDQSNGAIGISWHDARDDPANVTTRYYASFSDDGGATFTPNVALSSGTSNAAVAPPWPAHPTIDYGDYSGNSFSHGRFMPVWADNSNATADNPDGTLHAFDVNTTVVAVTSTAQGDFSVSSVPPVSATIGGSGTSPVTVGSLNAFSAPVSLDATTVSGIAASFSPNPVTPPAGGSALSTLRTALAPFVIPGTYDLTVTGTSNSLSHSMGTSVDVVATTGGLVDVIAQLWTAGCIDSAGLVNTLDAQLADAQAAIDAGKRKTAANILSSFIRQVQSQTGKHVAASCTIGSTIFSPSGVLVTDALSIIASTS